MEAVVAIIVWTGLYLLVLSIRRIYRQELRRLLRRRAVEACGENLLGSEAHALFCYRLMRQ